jgi:MbtH protein
MTTERTNPFDVEDGIFLVLANDKDQLSLWPDFAAVPAGWTVAVGPDRRPLCIDHIETRWSGALRPASRAS